MWWFRCKKLTFYPIACRGPKKIIFALIRHRTDSIYIRGHRQREEGKESDHSLIIDKVKSKNSKVKTSLLLLNALRFSSMNIES